MDVKINSAITSAINARSQQQSRVEHKHDGHAEQIKDIRSARTSQADRIELTDTAKHLQMLEAMVADQPVIDSQRVNYIQQAISDGRLEINPERVADKMISMETTIARHLYDS